MLTPLFRSAVVWTVVGLVGGLVYREVTKAADFVGATQLAVVHTHALTLGTVFLLGVLALERLFDLSALKRGRWFLPIWNIGLVLTVAMQGVKGYLQVHHAAVADSPALAGVSGLGHMTLTAGFILLLLALRTRLRAVQQEPAVADGQRDEQRDEQAAAAR